jgi:hypothetical protein
MQIMAPAFCLQNSAFFVTKYYVAAKTKPGEEIRLIPVWSVFGNVA